MLSTATRDGIAAGIATLALMAAPWLAAGPAFGPDVLALSVLPCTIALAAAGIILVVTARTITRRHSAAAAWLGCGLLLMTGLGGLIGEAWRLSGAPDGGWLAAIPLAALVVHVGLDRAAGVRHHTPVVLVLLSAAGVVLLAPALSDVVGVPDWEVQVVVSAGALGSLAWRCSRHPALPDVHRAAVAWGVGALALDSILAVLGLAGPWSVLRAAVAVGGTTALLSVAWRWASEAGREAVVHVDGLVRELDEQRQRTLLARSLLHDARATLAGLRDAGLALALDEISAEERRCLAQALAVESARVARQLEGCRHRGEACRLDDALSPLVTTARRRGVDVVYEPSTVLVDADADTVAEIVRNLVDNAAVHAPGATVRLLTEVVGGNVLVSVVDNGPGIPRELRADAFAAGTRGAASRGEGLGLASASRLAAEANGELRLLDASPGACLQLLLPAPRKAG